MSTDALSTEEGHDALLVSLSPNGLYLAYITHVESDASEFNQLFWSEGIRFISLSS